MEKTQNGRTRTFDVCVVGHVTRDVNTIDGVPQAPSPGGTAYYSSMAYRSLGLRTAVVTRLATEDQPELLDEIRRAGIAVICLPSRRSTIFENIYPTADPDIRFQRVDAIGDPFAAGDVADVTARVFHFGPLTRADIPISLLEAAHQKGGCVALGAQGYLRVVAGGAVDMEPWPDLEQCLRWVHVFQADVEETRLFAEEMNIPRAVEKLAALAPGEIVTTDGSHGSRHFVDGRTIRIPSFPPRRRVDATGCGDTYLAGYLARRMTSGDITHCATFAAAMASLKLEAVGPFRGGGSRVLARMGESSPIDDRPRPRELPLAGGNVLATPGDPEAPR